VKFIATPAASNGDFFDLKTDSHICCSLSRTPLRGSRNVGTLQYSREAGLDNSRRAMYNTIV
jgi:hypothetical protein